MCVVKADGYGHGAFQVARACRGAGADMFGVSSFAEAKELRDAGITEPILILSEPPRETISDLISMNIMPTIDTMEFAMELGERAAALGTVAPYHLKIDTGMNRIGVHHLDVLEFMRNVDFHRGLTCDGTFTHFATAENLNDWDFALQLRRFVEAVSALHNEQIEYGTVHCCNTAATIMHPEAHFDMVRLGIGIYGLHPSDTTKNRIQLEPAMSIHARATYVKRPAIGEGVSYGLTYRVPKNVQIATLPLGYADGLDRRLSNNMDVIFRGKRVRQVGRICMDQCMIEVDSNLVRRDPLEPIDHGDHVIVVGVEGNESITLDEMALKLGTIHYELACRFGMRLDRVYV